MIRNIDILIKLKEYVDRYEFMFDEVSVKSEIEKKPLDEMITVCDEDVFALFHMICNIDKSLIALTEDVSDTILHAGLDCNDYVKWSNHIKHNPMIFTGLYETINEAHKILEAYLDETFRGYKILTQPAYIQDDLEIVTKYEGGTE